jgi:hypothetical protein
LRAVVAIPARDEETLLPACLAALSCQDGGSPIEVVVVLDNCRDRSADIVRRHARAAPFPIHAVETRLPPERATAARARRAALELAAWRLEEAGVDPDEAVLLSTDADSRVARDWLARNLAAIDAGADAIAGVFIPDPAGFKALDPWVRRRLAGERRYRRLLERLVSLIDPEPHDPWPRHPIHSGASIATRLSTYRKVGGLPPVAVGEDEAFFAAVRRADGRVRHDPRVRVVTSCRLDGRARGGMADTLRGWSGLSAPVGSTPESLRSAVRRAVARARIRIAWDRRAADPRLARRLGLNAQALQALFAAPTLGLALEAVERRLPPSPLAPRDLPREIGRARRLFALLLRRRAPPQHAGA